MIQISVCDLTDTNIQHCVTQLNILLHFVGPIYPASNINKRTGTHTLDVTDVPTTFPRDIFQKIIFLGHMKFEG